MSAAPRPRLSLRGGGAGESDVQRQIIRALTALPQVAFVARINSGAFLREGSDGATGFYSFCTIHSALQWDFLPKFFQNAGFRRARLRMPDVIGMLKGGRLFAFEIKSHGEKATPGQAAFLDLLRANGAIAQVARSVDDILEALK